MYFTWVEAQEREESAGDVTGALMSAARPLTLSTALDSDGSRYLYPRVLTLFLDLLFRVFVKLKKIFFLIN